MSKITTLKPLVTKLAPPIGYARDDEAARHRYRDSTQTYRRWYKTARWQKLRWAVLVRDLFKCQRPQCGRVEANTSQLVADHKVPHRADERLFWDESNLQCICKQCHDRDKQREERRGW